MAIFHSVIPKLPAKDLKETKAFYINKLQFKQLGGDYPDYLMLYRDGVELHFFLHPELDLHTNDGMCYIRVTQIEELYEGLATSEGIDCLGTLEDRPWGQKEFSLVDNNNNQLTFGEEIKLSK
jgi:catechol 2,3-dioxygenase-like lactoylglutathione lyase family enzyme